jgi:hypothetical protein
VGGLHQGAGELLPLALFFPLLLPQVDEEPEGSAFYLELEVGVPAFLAPVASGVEEAPALLLPPPLEALPVFAREVLPLQLLI